MDELFNKIGEVVNSIVELAEEIGEIIEIVSD